MYLTTMHVEVRARRVASLKKVLDYFGDGDSLNDARIEENRWIVYSSLEFDGSQTDLLRELVELGLTIFGLSMYYNFEYEGNLPVATVDID